MRLPLSAKYDKPSYEALRKIRQQQVQIIELMKLSMLQQQRATCAHAHDPQRLLVHEHRTFSQHGEDGIIAEIFRRIGTTNKAFVEFGAGNGLENNTVALLCRGFTGFWIEGGVEQAAAIRKN